MDRNLPSGYFNAMERKLEFDTMKSLIFPPFHMFLPQNRTKIVSYATGQRKLPIYFIGMGEVSNDHYRNSYLNLQKMRWNPCRTEMVRNLGHHLTVLCITMPIRRLYVGIDNVLGEYGEPLHRKYLQCIVVVLIHERVLLEKYQHIKLHI